VNSKDDPFSKASRGPNEIGANPNVFSLLLNRRTVGEWNYIAYEGEKNGTKLACSNCLRQYSVGSPRSLLANSRTHDHRLGNPSRAS